ncbi:PspC domain-containing protein [Vicingus serpentipes]|uniref:PspC domain-containing protein n=1 Tax=Vicingus serpentipes TaxID=1926625 RepID=A0A5C6RSC6_9FLAO|nr:PspC domain-containing protein [Vicingus serpentipes]TXB65336.1 PspC domain-containing protein [Vicingus serpentipes]
MNKTVTVNISGIVFHIEVDAYDTLKNYLNKIKGYFNNSEEREEIMTDIESRIAELFSNMMDDKNQVITSENVTSVIETMGKPEQYLDEDSEEEFESPKESKLKSDKKLFRNPDDRILGGVASGLASYFGLDAVWLRLFFVLTFIFAGFGPFLYIILWIVMPEAKTASDKLKMKGDPINVTNIGRTFEDEAKKVNEKLKTVDTKKFGYFLEQFFKAIGQILKAVFNVLGNIIGFAFLVIGVFLAVGFIAGLSGSDMIYAVTSDGVFSIESTDFFNLIFVSEDQFHLAIFGIILLFGIPIIAIIYGGLKILFNIKTHFSFGIALVVFWLVGASICGLISIKMGTELSSQKTITEPHTLPAYYNNYNLTANTTAIPGNGILDGKFSAISLDNDSIYQANVSVNIYKSKTDSAKLVIIKHTNGESKKGAITKAKNINYSFAITDSTINLNNYFSNIKTDKIRGQRIKVKLYLPEGKSVYLDESISELVYDIPNVTNTWDSDMMSKKWVMTKDGLTCLDCKDIEGATSDELMIRYPSLYNVEIESPIISK